MSDGGSAPRWSGCTRPSVRACVPQGLLTVAPPASIPGLAVLLPSCACFVDVELAQQAQQEAREGSSRSLQLLVFAVSKPAGPERTIGTCKDAIDAHT